MHRGVRGGGRDLRDLHERFLAILTCFTQKGFLDAPTCGPDASNCKTAVDAYRACVFPAGPCGAGSACDLVPATADWKCNQVCGGKKYGSTARPRAR